ncbi:hypothetical protein PFLUV_G00259960 [Perca fluviatilis]|uniref:FIIND domain-containing protein n=1 Tax=Perca fluviatilis TaxID=8168 RepID=A0A6A5DZS3_PERFL|nr:hypothetical protein PFLUV_G00259960 [Perca fluviatilis]
MKLKFGIGCVFFSPCDGSDPPPDPSTSKTNLDVSEDRREDQLSPDDPEKLKQQQLVGGEAPNTNDTVSFTPELLTESGKTSYRFRCPGPGVFQCALTGLVFVTTQEAELLYNTVQWDESLLQSAGRMAAGPLYDIKCSEEAAVCQLHFPHCEIIDAPLPDGLLSVVHITDDGMSILEPLEITDTHVVVREQHHESRNIWVPATCKLIKDQSYTVQCPQAIKIQPEKADFELEFGPNYHPTFEIRLPINTPEVTLKVKDEGQSVWEHDVELIAPNHQTPAPAEDRDPAEVGRTAEVLLNTLEDLGAEDFETFKWFLMNSGEHVKNRPIPRGRLENATLLNTVDLMIQTFSGTGAVEVTKLVLKKINRNDLLERLAASS